MMYNIDTDILKEVHMNENQNTEFKPETEDEYNKRPIWQWVALYVVVAAALYGIIYLMLILAGY